MQVKFFSLFFQKKILLKKNFKQISEDSCEIWVSVDSDKVESRVTNEEVIERVESAIRKGDSLQKINLK